MENKGLLITLIVLVALVSIVSVAISVNNQVDEQALSDKVTAQVIKGMPTPEEVNVSELATSVAALIPEVEVPEFASSNMVEDLWEDLYDDEIDELKAEAYDVAVEELEDRDYKLLTKWLEENVEHFDELKDVDVDDYKTKVIELGLKKDEDKCAVVTFELKVRYTLDEGETTRYKKNILAIATVDFDEGDYDDEDVKLIFE